MNLKIIKPPIQNACIAHKPKSYSNCLNYESPSYHAGDYYSIGQTLLIGKYDSVYRALIQFDLSSLPFFLNITSGTLGLFLSKNETPLENTMIDIYPILSPWCEENVSWGNQPLITDMPIANIIVPNSILGCTTANITTLIQQWHNGETANLGLLLKAHDETQVNVIGVHSKEYPNSSNWPFLQIDYLHSACPSPPVVPLTMNKKISITAIPTLQWTAEQDVLLFNYSYLIINIGDFPAQACLEISADNIHWERQSEIHLIEPEQQITFVPNTIAHFARLSYQTLEPTATTLLSVYIQGRT